MLNAAHAAAQIRADVIGVDNSGLRMGSCNALFEFEALHYAGIVVLRFIPAFGLTGDVVQPRQGIERFGQKSAYR